MQKFITKSNPKTNSKTMFLTVETKELIRSQSYIGKKGYTIPKSVLSKDEYEFLKKDLLPFLEILQVRIPY